LYKERKTRIAIIKWLIRTLNFKESCRIYFIWKENHNRILDKIFNKTGEENAD